MGFVQKQKPQAPDTLGYPIRKPYGSEDEFFKKNPTVAGMAAEDDRIILNPYSKLSASEKAAVAKNEAYRIYMRQKDVNPSFKVTQDQMSMFTGTAYAKDEKSMKQTIIARILSGDPSAKATPEQIAEADKIRSRASNERKK